MVMHKSVKTQVEDKLMTHDLSSFTWQFVDMSRQVYIRRRNTFTAHPTIQFARDGLHSRMIPGSPYRQL